MASQKPVIFISYDTDEALQYAKEAKQILEGCDYRTWVWHFDRRAAGYKQREMATNIRASDYFLLICTEATRESQPQTYEREMAWNCNKIPPLLIIFDKAHVPVEWEPYLFNDAAQTSLQAQCSRIVDYLRGQQQLESEAADVEYLRGEQQLEREAVDTEKGQSLNTRDEQIAAIKKKADRLDEDRLNDCYEQVLQGYDSQSIVESFARVTPVPDRTPSDFRVLTNSEARRIDHFNDSAYYWDFYCAQLGRTIALAETRYMFEELQKEVAAEGEPISAEDPSFGALASAVSLLRTRGFTPDALYAPIGLFVPFAGDASLTIDWNASPREVVILQGGVRLKLHWSSGGAPLDRFVVLDSSQMTWNVKPDPETGRRLTVAIGQSRIATGEEAVVFLAETVAKFEVHARAAVAVALDGEPLDSMEYVNQEQLR